MTGPEQATILLVDDREENLLALEAILSSLGHRLLRARSGAEALKHLLREEVSLILLDVQMPEMDGYETAAHVQSRPRTRNIPIIFLTAIDHEAHQAYRGYAAGAVDFLAKPFDPWMLRAKVQVFLKLYLERQLLEARVEEMQRQIAELSGHALDSELAQVERLLTMVGGGNAQPLLDEAIDRLRAVRARLVPHDWLSAAGQGDG
ncbi:MAG: response regulator [Acidimicrobiaceae bacterium]|nr:response regulator [Acidimicrobiaceae bacterium]